MKCFFPMSWCSQSLALLTGPAEVEQKIFLSTATLLIVPPALVQHWVGQVTEHVAFNALKVLVLTADKQHSNKMPPVHALAWDYDLVSNLQLSGHCMTLLSSLQYAAGDCTLPAISFKFSFAQCNTHWPWLYLQAHYFLYRCLWFCDQAMMCRNMSLVSLTSPKAFVSLQPLITVFSLSFCMMYRSSQPWRNWAQLGQRRTGDIPLHSYRSAFISLWTRLRCIPLTSRENSRLTHLLHMHMCSAMLDKQTGKYRLCQTSGHLCPVQDTPLILWEAGKTLVSWSL